MNKSFMLDEYLGYVGSIEHSDEDNVFFGKILFIPDLILYESTTLEGLEPAFHEAVDSYLANCKATNRKPHTTCKGSFNIRIPQQLHVDLVRYGIEHDCSLNKTVTTAIENFLLEQKRPKRVTFSSVSLKSNLGNLIPAEIRHLYALVH